MHPSQDRFARKVVAGCRKKDVSVRLPRRTWCGLQNIQGVQRKGPLLFRRANCKPVVDNVHGKFGSRKNEVTQFVTDIDLPEHS
jgi:hypothetical protein